MRGDADADGGDPAASPRTPPSEASATSTCITLDMNIYRVRKLERPLPLRLYLYFLKWKGTAAICTFYLKKGAIPYSQIPPVRARLADASRGDGLGRKVDAARRQVRAWWRSARLAYFLIAVGAVEMI